MTGLRSRAATLPGPGTAGPRPLTTPGKDPPDRPSVAGEAEAGPQADRVRRSRPRPRRPSPSRTPRGCPRRPSTSRSGAHARCPACAVRARRAGSPSSRTAACASASASSLAKSSPAAPWSSTWAKASRSLASTGAPADIASTRMIPKLSPPVLGATYRSTLRSRRALSSSLTMPRNSTLPAHLASAGTPPPPPRRPGRRPAAGCPGRRRGSSAAPASVPAGPCAARRSGR